MEVDFSNDLISKGILVIIPAFRNAITYIHNNMKDI